MGKVSAGLLMWKKVDGIVKVLLVHPGGPYWKGKEEGCWDIPKGEVANGEEIFEAAKREFKEETGINPPKEKNRYLFLGKIKRKDGKEVNIWAFEGEWDGTLICSSFVEMEYPFGSKKIIKFPEVDKAGFFYLEEAKKRAFPSLNYFLSELEKGIS